MITDSLLLGTGSGSFKFGYVAQVSGERGWRAIVSDDPHQQYLLIWAEQGLIGLLLFCSAIMCWLASVKDKGTTTTCAICILTATAVSSFANGHFGTFVEGRLVWIFVPALLSSSPRIFNDVALRSNNWLIRR